MIAAEDPPDSGESGHQDHTRSVSSGRPPSAASFEALLHRTRVYENGFWELLWSPDHPRPNTALVADLVHGLREVSKATVELTGGSKARAKNAEDLYNL